MNFFLRLLIGLTLTFSSHIVIASDSNIMKLEASIKVKEAELDLLKQQLISAKKDLVKTQEIGEVADEEPCTCVFNKNRMWNPEKVMWNSGYWICSIYKDDGTCSEVKKIKDVTFE